MSRLIKILAAATTAAAVCFAVIYCVTSNKVMLTLAITFGVTAFHFVMRLAVGLSFNAAMKNRADYHKPWFRQRKWERGLYKKLGVKRWKGRMPSYDPTLFDPSLHSFDEIAQAMCQAELVHETIAVLSFLPLLMIIPFGEPAVFIITSVLSAAFDLCFVIVQRYNRPRVVRLADRTRQTSAPDPA